MQVHLRHAPQVVLRRLLSHRVALRHLHLGARLCQRLGFAGRQQPIVANTFEPGGQHMQKETAYKLHAIECDNALSTFVIGAHLERHLIGSDIDDALVADGCAVGIARQVLQHLSRATQWGFGIHHPVKAVQRLVALGSIQVGTLGIVGNLTVLMRRLQGGHELASEHGG